MQSIDVRTIPLTERHARVFMAFDSLPERGVLRIISDHEPRPLRYDFNRLRSGQFAWAQKHIEDGHWETLIRRLDSASISTVPRKLLRRTWMFADMQEAEILALSSHAKFLNARRNEPIVEQGQMWPYLGIVASGTVQACTTTSDGRELALYEHLANDVFGHIAIADGESSPVRYTCRSDGTVVMLLPRADVLEAIKRDEQLGYALLSLVSQSTRMLIDRFAALTKHPIVARLAGALLLYAAPKEGLHPPLGSLERMRQVEFAAVAGTGKELVYRALAELEAARAIERDQGRIVALDRRRLEDFARLTKY